MLTYQSHNSTRSSGAGFGAVSIPEHSSATGHIFNTKPESVGDVTTRFGSRLRQLRRDRNLTQMQMAHRFGIDRSYISEVERGHKSVSLVTLELIALGFRMSMSDIMNNI
jgi:DNA-binding XRE family transcriptional regulator